MYSVIIATRFRPGDSDGRGWATKRAVICRTSKELNEQVSNFYACGWTVEIYKVEKPK